MSISEFTNSDGSDGFWKTSTLTMALHFPPFFGSTYTKDMVAALLAEQNMDILEEIETLKKDFKGAFIAFAEHIEAFMEAIVKDVKEPPTKKLYQK